MKTPRNDQICVKLVSILHRMGLIDEDTKNQIHARYAGSVKDADSKSPS